MSWRFRKCILLLKKLYLTVSKFKPLLLYSSKEVPRTVVFFAGKRKWESKVQNTEKIDFHFERLDIDMSLRGSGGGGGRRIRVLAFVLVFVLLFFCVFLRQFIQCAQSQHDIILCNKHEPTLRETYELTKQTLVRSHLAHYNKRSTITSTEIQTAVRLLLPGELAKHSSGMAHYNKKSTITTSGEIQTAVKLLPSELDDSSLAHYNKRSGITTSREIKHTAATMPKGSGLTKPMKLSRPRRQATPYPRDVSSKYLSCNFFNA